jgi:hypothetical protein
LRGSDPVINYFFKSFNCFAVNLEPIAVRIFMVYVVSCIPTADTIYQGYLVATLLFITLLRLSIALQ